MRLYSLNDLAIRGARHQEAVIGETLLSSHVFPLMRSAHVQRYEVEGQPGGNDLNGESRTNTYKEYEYSEIEGIIDRQGF